MHILRSLFLFLILILTGCTKTTTTSQKYSMNPDSLEKVQIENKSILEDLPELSWTPGTMEQYKANLKILAQRGDEAIPYLEQFIDQKIKTDTRYSYAYIPNAFGVLGKIHTDKSTELIKKYYSISNTRAYAATALSYKPYRIEAKDEYIDILKGKEGKFQRYYAVEACVEYKWKDSLPYIEMICEKPFTWNDFITAYRAKKTLDDDPISNEMSEAFNSIKRYLKREDIETAKEIILQLPEKESASVLAIDLLFTGYKTRTQKIDDIHNAAWDILRALPKETTKPLIGRLLSSIDSRTKPGFPELKLFYESY